MEELGLISRCEFSYDGEEASSRAIGIFKQAIQETIQDEEI
jgi:hypothetical protein